MATINDILKLDLNEDIKNVIDLEDRSQDEIQSEIESYIVTDGLGRHLSNFINQYTSNIKETGVWLSGFYGSGKATERADQSNKVNAGGVGFRYQIARRYGLHLGMDYAQSHEERAIYFNIGSGF